MTVRSEDGAPGAGAGGATRDDAGWVTSRHSSGNGGNCVQARPGAAAAAGVVPVRDSKRPDGPTLRVPAAAWRTFLASL